MKKKDCCALAVAVAGKVGEKVARREIERVRHVNKVALPKSRRWKGKKRLGEQESEIGRY